MRVCMCMYVHRERGLKGIFLANNFFEFFMKGFCSGVFGFVITWQS